MRQTLRSVSRFFKRVVDNVPLPRVYIPELAGVPDIRHISLRKILNLKGRSSSVINELRKMINAVNWLNAWLSLISYSYGWFGVSKIYWRKTK